MPTESLAKDIGPRDKMEYDVVIVGAGPCGLATAIRLKQHAVPHNRELNACVLENGSEPGAQILSGAIMDPLAITELLPTRNEMGVPLKQEVTSDEFLLLSETGARTAPTSSCPDCFCNHGNLIVSLGSVVRWLGQRT